MKQVDISISGMSCAGCASNVEGIIAKDPSVSTVSVSLATNSAKLTANDNMSINIDNIINMLKDAGFTATLDETKQ